MLELFGPILPTALRSALGDQDGAGRAGKEQQNDGQGGGS